MTPKSKPPARVYAWIDGSTCHSAYETRRIAEMNVEPPGKIVVYHKRLHSPDEAVRKAEARVVKAAMSYRRNSQAAVWAGFHSRLIDACARLELLRRRRAGGKS